VPNESKGSKRHICWYVNEAPEYLNAALFSASRSLAAAAVANPDWVSPLIDDNYEECWNERFLERLDLLDEYLGSFRNFWPFNPWVDGKISPRGTPHWDALARVRLRGRSFGAVMIEAKAHRGELVKPNDSSKAQPDALDKIKKSFAKARDYYDIPPSAPPSESRYYQVCNRLAHLYWMNEVAKVPTWLAWVLILDDPVWPDRLSAVQWHDAFETVKREVGLPVKHRLDDRLVVAYLPPAPPPTGG
jgi:hypothetical protein